VIVCRPVLNHVGFFLFLPACRPGSARKKDVQMPKDSKKTAAARSRSQMDHREVKSAARVKAVRRAVRDVLSERQTKRRNRQLKGKAGR
jgi:hypothetical protein